MRKRTCPVCGARCTGRTCPSCGSDWPDDHTALFNAERNELADEERREEEAEQEAEQRHAPGGTGPSREPGAWSTKDPFRPARSSLLGRSGAAGTARR